MAGPGTPNGSCARRWKPNAGPAPARWTWVGRCSTSLRSRWNSDTTRWLGPGPRRPYPCCEPVDTGGWRQSPRPPTRLPCCVRPAPHPLGPPPSVPSGCSPTAATTGAPRRWWNCDAASSGTPPAKPGAARDAIHRCLPFVLGHHPTRDRDEIADTLQTHAWYVATRAPELAAALLGAGDRIRRRPIPAAIQSIRERAATAARRTLGTKRFDADHQAGAMLDADGLLDLCDRIAAAPETSSRVSGRASRPQQQPDGYRQDDRADGLHHESGGHQLEAQYLSNAKEPNRQREHQREQRAHHE